MAMYYYASKISAIACGTRCRVSVLQKSRGHRDRDKHEEFLQLKESHGKMDISFNQEVSYPIKCKSTEDDCDGTMRDSPEEEHSPTVPASNTSVEHTEFQLGTDGILYEDDSATIASGPLDALVNLLLRKTVDEEFEFSFLLSSRLFIQPHELLGTLLSSVPEHESLERLVYLLGVWTKMFPYDFRDERIMNHVKHIVSRCSNTGLEDVVSIMLSALLNRLTDLEKHEEDLKACRQNNSTCEKTDFIEYSSPAQLAQILCRIERKLAKHVGPEEIVQCSSNVLVECQSKYSTSSLASSNLSSCQDTKKTCNLEMYLEWSVKLRLFVANEILKANDIQKRSKTVELWSGVAQYCLLVGNYNSATAILESLESPPIARLKETWYSLTTTSQLDCMVKHAEGCSDLWSRQAVGPYHTEKASIQTLSKVKSNEWVVIPVFSDIVQLALSAREDCMNRLPNGNLNLTAFNRLAAIVRAFIIHMSEVKLPVSDAIEYDMVCRQMQKATLLYESDLMLASFDCEKPLQEQNS